jgi:threonine synthase
MLGGRQLALLRERPPQPAETPPQPASRRFTVRPSRALVSAEMAKRRAIAADPALSIAERLEAFNDLLESEVGDTNLHRARNLERECDLRQIYLKFEGGNPSGTQKDRIAFAQVADALRRGYDAITVATCGNYGVAVAMAAWLAGLRCTLFVPEKYTSRRIEEMVAYGGEIRRIAADYEDTVLASQAWAAEAGVYDGNPGGENVPIQLQAYGQIAYEIYDELRDAPAIVAVPVSNGSTLAGIHRGFQSLYRRGKTSRMPRIVGGSTHRMNPIVHGFLKGMDRCPDLDPTRIHETSVNEPLINWHSIDGDHALSAIRQTGGWAEYATDRQLREFARLLRCREGLDVLPASTAGLIALLTSPKRTELEADRFVVILTGRGT